MGGAYSVKADLLTYTKENFTYWKQYKSLYDQSGSISDIIPSTLTSNLISSTEPVQGIFSLVAKTSVSKLLRRGEVGGYNVEPFCGTPGIFIPYPMPSECCNCLLFPNSTLQKPSYW